MNKIKKENCTLYVPLESINEYKATEPWSEFLLIESIEKYTLGDANGDYTVDVADFTAIANDILGNRPEIYREMLADANKDEQINIADITAVANIILYGSVNPFSLAKAIIMSDKEKHIPALLITDFAVSAGEDYVMDVDIDNPDTEFSAFQFDIHLPKGMTVKDVQLATDRTNARKTNYMDFATLPDGTTRVVCASTKDIAFEGTAGTVAKVTVAADESTEKGEYSVTIDNIVLSKAGTAENAEAVTVNANVGTTTGIDEKQEDMHEDGTVYDMLGRKTDRKRISSKGVYIIKGKKVVM